MVDELSFHSVCIQGAVHHVDDETRKEIESWMRDDGASVLVVDSIHGEELTIAPSHVSNIWSSTPETRRRLREHEKAMDAEVPVGDR